ncbi:7203_t:CDS:2 [Racocetra fulgida]|uniref:7203_t:CDS:1 n=1 Tax=Racocetra fulgida TaxID=60492 RepID=A0A9N8WDI6_9GLOM|nr:7203_t:CDS:2 [Racocetra fulgida]
MAVLVKDMILENLIERWGDPSEIGIALHHATIQNMRRQFNELCPTSTPNNNTTPDANNDNLTLTFLHPLKI